MEHADHADRDRETVPIEMNKRYSLNPVELELLARCEARLGYSFSDRKLLYEAITHASSSSTRLKSYERLEFLGDSILGFVVCEYLYNRFPTWLEGDLTKVKSVVVSRKTCARIGQELQLDEFIVVGKGIGQRGSVPSSLLANAFESIIGAIYLDGGMAPASEFLHQFVESYVDMAVAGETLNNHKSELQQLSQKRYGIPPTYHLLGNRGPDHDKSFQVQASVEGTIYSPAWGKNKKEAEQRAAANALAEINGDEPPFAE